MTSCPPLPRPNPPLRRLPLCAALCLILGSTAAQAQLSPYYFRASERISYDSNVFRVPEALGVRRDAISTTSLTVGVDQPIGRQRVYGSATGSGIVYKNNDQLNSTGYNLLAGLGWEAGEKWSGDARINAVQTQANLADYGNLLQTTSGKNLERANFVDLRAQYGGASLLSLEGSANHTDVRYSSNLFASRELRSNRFGLGLRYRPGADWTFGLTGRKTRGRYPQGAVDNGVLVPDEFDRNDIDLSAQWQATGDSNLLARVSHTKEDHDRDSTRDFSGVTGELRWIYQATGKVRTSVGYIRDTGSSIGNGNGIAPAGGQSGGSVPPSALTLPGGYLSDSRLSDRINLGVNWAATAKIDVAASFDYSRDRYDNLFVGGSSASSGRSRATGLTVNYAITRVWSLGCGASREERSTDATVGGTAYDYRVTTGYCSVQFAVQ